MKKTSMRLHIAELAPTQPTIGAFEVRLKADRFALMSPHDTQGYLDAKRRKGKPVLVVKGPGAYFLVDGHHTMSGIRAADLVQEVTVMQVADLSGTTDVDAFWAEMQQRGWALCRAHGEDCGRDTIPRALTDLADDPYRALAWLIRKMGAYDDLKRPYQEFEIADFLRARMPFAPTLSYQYERAALHAYELMRSEAASGLPGYRQAEAETNLVRRYYDVLAKARAPRVYRD